jgi:hypothetical protein
LTRRYSTRCNDEREVAAALGVGRQDLRGALIDAGSWLIATSMTHPFPHDRMALAEKRFVSLLGNQRHRL